MVATEKVNIFKTNVWQFLHPDIVNNERKLLNKTFIENLEAESNKYLSKTESLFNKNTKYEKVEKISDELEGEEFNEESVEQNKNSRKRNQRIKEKKLIEEKKIFEQVKKEELKRAKTKTLKDKAIS